jgi:hypothetical protein
MEPASVVKERRKGLTGGLKRHANDTKEMVIAAPHS